MELVSTGVSRHFFQRVIARKPAPAKKSAPTDTPIPTPAFDTVLSPDGAGVEDAVVVNNVFMDAVVEEEAEVEVGNSA